MPLRSVTLDATAQAAMIADGELSAEEAVRAALERAELLEDLGTTTVLLPERALRQAAEATGPFAGVPILLKDAGQELDGTPLHMGTRALKAIDDRSSVTTPLARHLEEELGFVIIGKTAVPELMSGVATEPPTGQPTRNPWNRSLTAGGSSGGSAAAVAAGIVALAHGSDSTGSLRYPASCCGVQTLKPTAGRIESQLPAGLVNRYGFHTDFVLGRSIRDLRSVLAHLSPTADRHRNLQPPTRPARIGVLRAMPFNLSIASEVTQALSATADQLAAAGNVIVPIDHLFLERYGSVLGEMIPPLVDASRAKAVDWIEERIGRRATAADLSPEILAAAERGRSQPAQAGSDAHEAIRGAALAAARWTDSVDALLLPILDVAPWTIGTDPPGGNLAGLICSLANMSGQPSVAIPTIDKRGIPIGVQLQGPANSDEWLLDTVATVQPTAPRCPLASR